MPLAPSVWRPRVLLSIPQCSVMETPPQQLLIPLSKTSVVEKLQSRSVSWKILLKVIFSNYFNIFLGQVFGQGRRDWDRRRSRLSQAWMWKALPFLVSPQSPVSVADAAEGPAPSTCVLHLCSRVSAHAGAAFPPRDSLCPPLLCYVSLLVSSRRSLSPQGSMC